MKSFYSCTFILHFYNQSHLLAMDTTFFSSCVFCVCVSLLEWHFFLFCCLSILFCCLCLCLCFGYIRSNRLLCEQSWCFGCPHIFPETESKRMKHINSYRSIKKTGTSKLVMCEFFAFLIALNFFIIVVTVKTASLSLVSHRFWVLRLPFNVQKMFFYCWYFLDVFFLLAIFCW